MEIQDSFDLNTHFDGDDYQHDRDYKRLEGQIHDIFSVIRDGKWKTLSEIEDLTGHPHASISAQLRNLRKPRFGSFIIDRRHVGCGLYQYRLAGKQDKKSTHGLPDCPDLISKKDKDTLIELLKSGQVTVTPTHSISDDNQSWLSEFLRKARC